MFVQQALLTSEPPPQLQELLFKILHWEVKAMGAGEMASRLRVPSALAEDPAPYWAAHSCRVETRMYT